MPTPTLATHSTRAEVGVSALPPVVLLHGFAASADEDFGTTGWPASFTAAGRDVHLLDLPGHGDSPAVSGDAARTGAVVAAIVDAIDLILDGADADRVDVVGYSLGARLAWELPATGRVRRLVLGGLSPFEPFAAVDVAAVRRAASGETAADEAAADPMIGMMAGMVSAPGRDTASLLAMMEGLGAEPFQPDSPAPEVPTLLAAGVDDGMAAGLDALAARIPDAEFLRVPGDHRGALDSPEFRAAAIAFLAR
ncbi:alpha/beta fold hydrolase [Leifsonia sp. NPDC080035]|uniref:Alpha/beta fold hydrolase n=1 Tax=Leifsonia sp. NPDC080035 TaxID=3143936 RepID=A0AAU7GAU3_9MICO